MTAQLSLEELKQSLIECSQNSAGMFEVGEDVMCAMVALLEGRDSEPVAFVKSGYALCYFRPPQEYGLKIGDTLYAAPPAPVAVPDSFAVEKAVWDALNLAACPPAFMRIAAEACRAAMQAEPVTAATVPDGWTAAINRLLDSDGSRGCFDLIECNAAHREIERLIAAVPAAPEQEV